MRKLTIAFLAGIMLLDVSSLLAQEADTQDELPEKQVTFYNTYAYQTGDTWTIPIKLWVHEEPDFVRRLAARTARSQLQSKTGIDELTSEQEVRFATRADGFIADSESRETVRFLFEGDPDSTIYQITDENGRTRTDRNGLIEGSIVLTSDKMTRLLQAQNSSDGWLTVRAISDDHHGIGKIKRISRVGLSVISDVDDTIKITEIPLGEEAVLKNTFFREFLAAPCMAALYATFDDNTSFHYVSGGPWQLYQPLADFLFSQSAGFPAGSFHMKDVRTNPFESESYADIWRLVASGSQQVTVEQKIGQISTLLERFPERQFILIGDSGERDPEVFFNIKADYADRDIRFYIRDVADAINEHPDRLEGMAVIAPMADPEGRCSITEPEDPDL